MKKRILFVDDESNVLSGLKRMLHPMRNEWEMVFSESGAKALEEMARQPFDVVVSDMRMPGMNGAELLRETMQRYPATVRIVLSVHLADVFSGSQAGHPLFNTPTLDMELLEERGFAPHLDRWRSCLSETALD